MTPIALSCGEPAGIGSEIALKAWAALRDVTPFFWIGDPSHLPPGAAFEVINSPQQAAQCTALPVLTQPFVGIAIPGQPDPANAQGVIDAIATGVDLVTRGHASAICTAPIHKKALQDGADFAYPGHTEYLAALAGVEHVVMMLACSQLRVVPATIHIALSQVASHLTPAGLRKTIEITSAALSKDFGIPHPRIAIAGLNPHAGEGGKMGTEEVDWINALITDMQAQGHALRGPLPADTMFHAGARKTYDAAIAMYHDQALIPIKTIDFSGGVNITLGLPFVRTSPDHGTAFDIAGKGIADPDSLIASLKMAQTMAQARS